MAVRFLLQSTVLSVAVLVGYFVLPLTSSLAPDTILKLFGGLVLISALLAWNIVEILRSPVPGARAIGALMVAAPLFLTLFAASYYLMADAQPSAFSEPLTRFDALYFTVTTFATVGFGDITAVSATARVTVTVQMITGLGLVGLIARVVFGAVEKSRSRDSSQDSQSSRLQPHETEEATDVAAVAPPVDLTTPGSSPSGRRTPPR
jgi:hypothetical protein